MTDPKESKAPRRAHPDDALGQLSRELFALDDELSNAHAACCVVVALVDHFIAERMLQGDDAEAAVYAVHRLREHLTEARRQHAKVHDRAVAAGLSRPAAPTRSEDETAGADNGCRQSPGRRR